MPTIEVENIVEHEVLEYPLVLLEGCVREFSSLNLPLTESFIDARLGPQCGSFWPVATSTGQFKAFVLLPRPGKYTVTLRVGSFLQRTFALEYIPAVTRYIVRFYYQKCVDATHEGFDAPPGVDNSDQAALAKIRFNALLLQTATAELLHAVGLSRRTFAMEFAPDGLPVVQLLRSSFTNTTARSIHDQKLIHLVHKDINAYGLDNHVSGLEFKHAVILGCSKYNPSTRKAEGHTALGGEKVGVFGSCGLHTWPSHLGEITSCCLNNSKIDTRYLMDDSCYRGTFWANYSTGIGAFLHELGHTFGLGHSTSGIMARGFDDMNRLFCVYEINPKSELLAFDHSFGDGRLALNRRAITEISSRRGAHWNIGSALILKHCPWISKMPKQSASGPVVSWRHDIRGPVGKGMYDGQQAALGQPRMETTSSLVDLGAILVHADQFLNNIQTFSREEVASQQDSIFVSTGTKHLFVLMEDEFVTCIGVRAGAWIDGIQIHTNLRTSRWFGGFGGQFHVLKSADGHKIDRFFGTIGDRFVGTLGVYCSPIDPRHLHLQPTIMSIPGSIATPLTFEKVGLGISDGEQRPFTVNNIDIGAIVIKCGSFVENFRVLSHEEHSRNIAMHDKSTYAPNEHVFELLPAEKLTKMEVASGHWVDWLKFETNLRKSPRFGGTGGVGVTTMTCRDSDYICGFFGSHGHKYLGSIGAFYCRDMNSTSQLRSDLESSASIHIGSNSVSAFSIMGISTPFVEGRHTTSPLGIIVCVQDNCVVYVQTFDTIQAYDELVNRLHRDSAGNTEVHCFTLEPGEKIVQIDASFRSDSLDCGTFVDGVCFHTSIRCSSWYGVYHNDNLRFYMAPAGSELQFVSGSYTYDSLTDIVGHVTTSMTPLNSQFSPDGRVKLDCGTYDIRVESTSSFGIESVCILKKNNGDHLDYHAWTWKQYPVPHPLRWCLPQKMLEYTVDGPNPKETLFKDYIVGAMDCGGGYSKSAGPP